MNFDTQLKKLKYEILKEVAILAREDRMNPESLDKIQYRIINGDKPKYRCCVYKERAIVGERVQLASGNVPGDEQIIHVISAACDNCPIYRFMVTEACRGCIQHKCQEVCPVGAVTNVAGRAYINQEICRECGLCKKECPYNAIVEVMRPCKKSCPTSALEINPEDKKAMINQEECINCGACMASCPFGAISDKSHIVDVINNLNIGKVVYGVVAPAFAGQFGENISFGMVRDGFIKTGFKDVMEAALGADAVTVHEGLELKERLEKGEDYMTSSCCPAFYNYIEKKHPQIMSKVSTTISPMAACGKLIKSMDKDAIVVFIGPCTAKKSEIKRPWVKKNIDYVLTFEEAAAIFGAFDIEIENCSDVEGTIATDKGRNFAKGGGLIEALKAVSSEINLPLKGIAFSGGDEVKQAMILAKAKRIDGNFIEGMMCQGGCVGGPGTISTKKAKQSLLKYSSSSKEKLVVKSTNLKLFDDFDLSM